MMEKIFAVFLLKFTFQRQLAITIGLGIFMLALLSSVVGSWLSTQRIRGNLLEQGVRITDSLARQSALALIYASADNVTEASRATLSFPGVVGVEIRDVNRRILLTLGETASGEFITETGSVHRAENTGAVLDAESPKAWRFVAPVYTQPASTPFDMTAAPELLGHVSVVVSKSALLQLATGIFVANLSTSLSFALLFLMLIRFLTNRITQPLIQLSASMGRAEAGELRVRAVLTGPKDIADMAHAFNSMMSVLGANAEENARINGKLRESEEKYRCIVDTATEGIWGLGPEAMTTFVNAGMAKMLGYSIIEMIGRPFAEFIFEDKAAYFRQKMADCQQGKAEHYECRFRCKDGQSLWALVSATPVFDAEHRFYGSFAMITDISARKRADDELRGYKDQLEITVQQRTEELLLALDSAKAANKAKSVFLANMSHELRTPLNAILGFSSMISRDQQLTENLREYLEIINRSGQHLLTLINNVLEMAKIEAGRLQLKEAPFDLGDTIRDVTDMMQLRAEEKDLRLLIDQSSRFPRYIIGDEVRFRQVLINLVGNALKFTQQGGVTIRLGTRKNKFSHLLIEVEDSGPGITPEDQQRIFEPFVQLGTHSVNLGTGLGLSITRQFVQLMGGSISLESTLGKGSLFRLDLPLKEVMEAEEAQSKPVKNGDVVGLALGQPEYRILIVEDQLENQLLLAKLMESVGLQVKIAENGEQGVRMFQSWVPNLIWMDRRMPVMDGVEAARAIRQLPGGKEVKIVAVTASVFIEQRNEIFAAGMDDILRKPYRADEIYGCLSKQLGVQFIYKSYTEPQDQSLKLAPQMLMALPEELRHKLKVAVETLDSEQIGPALQEVGSYDQNLKAVLVSLAEKFDYPSILNALRSN
jgi:PAS domain S-box-containing protein